MKIDAATAAILAAAVAGFFSTVTAICVVIFTKRSDERRHMRQISIEAAVENWKRIVESRMRLGEVTRTTVIEPALDPYIIHMILLSDFIAKGKFDAATIGDELRDIRSVSKAAMDATTRSRKTQ